jgi:hypothetical protein
LTKKSWFLIYDSIGLLIFKILDFANLLNIGFAIKIIINFPLAFCRGKLFNTLTIQVRILWLLRRILYIWRKVIKNFWASFGAKKFRALEISDDMLVDIFSHLGFLIFNIIFAVGIKSSGNLEFIITFSHILQHFHFLWMVSSRSH